MVTGSLFLLMAIIIRVGFTTSPLITDKFWMNLAYGTRNGFFNFLYGTVLSTLFGDLWGIVFALVIGGVLWFVFKEQIGAVWLVVMAGVSVVLNTVFKLIVGRARPVDDRLTGFINESGKSFASGHSVFATVVLGCIFLIFIGRMATARTQWTLAIVCGGLILLVMYARIYVGVHYPSDTLGGLLEGVTLLAFTYPYFTTAHRKEKSGQSLSALLTKKS
jgi:undecaprenyl-diphosphatase